MSSFAAQALDTASLYAPLDFVQVRLPLLPVETHATTGLLASQLLDAAPPSPELVSIRLALCVSSPALLDALERYPQSEQARAKLRRKVLRYLLRLCSRPTPFGLCAGIALGSWGEHTDLSIGAGCWRTRTRLDLGWLLNTVLFLETLPAIRQQLRFCTNSAVLISGGRAFLDQRAPIYGSPESLAVSVRATPLLQDVLRAARTPIAYADLAALIRALHPQVGAETVERFLAQLIEQTLLLSDLRPPLLVADPIGYVVQRLAAIPGCEPLAAELEALQQAARSCDTQAPAESIASRRQIQATIARLPLPATDTPLQTDSFIALDGRRLHRRVGADVARAAELLLALSPFSEGRPELAAYREAFALRYPLGREVPLLELINADFGLGLPPTSAEVGSVPRFPRRDAALLRLAAHALNHRQPAIELDAALLAELRTSEPTELTVPATCDLFVMLAAASSADVDSGKYQLVIGPTVGASEVGRSSGRFLDLLDPAAREAVQVQRGQAHSAPNCILAELSYLPAQLRHANLMTQPGVPAYQLCYGTTASGPVERSIPFHELVVGLHDKCLYLRWPRLGKNVQIRSGHMVQAEHAPGLCRFVQALAEEGKAQLVAFDWGPAASLPFLPRLTHGRIVLHLARWRIDAQLRARSLAAPNPAAFRRQLEQWRADWRVPALVYLRFGDNRLLLNLEDEPHIEELRQSIQQPGARLPIVLEEALPGPQHAWTPGAQGHFLAEFVVSLRLRTAPPGPSGEHATLQPQEQTTQPPRLDTLRPPGSDWLYVKFYCASAVQDELLAASVARLVQTALEAKLAEQWFFLRYADPEPHLRLRFHGRPEELIGVLLPRLVAWVQELLADGRCRRWSIETYDREVERYGGELGITLAEQLFAIDSDITLLLLRLLRRPDVPLDRIDLAVASCSALLDDLGVRADFSRRWRERNPTAWHQAGAHYRRRGPGLLQLLRQAGPLEQQLEAEAERSQLAALRLRRSSVVAALNDATQQGTLSQPLLNLAESFVHLHCNRLLGSDHATEELVLGLLARLCHSIEALGPYAPDGES
jgi:lantibiotic biosynthesis protein